MKHLCIMLYTYWTPLINAEVEIELFYHVEMVRTRMHQQWQRHIVTAKITFRHGHLLEFAHSQWTAMV